MPRAKPVYKLRVCCAPDDTPPGARTTHPSYVDFAALSADVTAA